MCLAVLLPSLCQVGDGILGTSQGVLRGLGRQAQLMFTNVACFWCVGVPTGYWLTFKQGWGLEGEQTVDKVTGIS